MKQPRKNLPPLSTDTAYVATDFEAFDYFGSVLTGAKAVLRLHLKNGTTIDLPTNEAELRRLALVLCDAFGPDVIAHLRERGWI